MLVYDWRRLALMWFWKKVSQVMPKRLTRSALVANSTAA
jgi:hypothetical protein